MECLLHHRICYQIIADFCNDNTLMVTIMAHQILYGDIELSEISKYIEDNNLPDIPNGAMVAKDRRCLTSILLTNDVKMLTAFCVMCHYGGKFQEEEVFKTLFELDTIYMKK